MHAELASVRWSRSAGFVLTVRPEIVENQSAASLNQSTQAYESSETTSAFNNRDSDFGRFAICANCVLLTFATVLSALTSAAEEEVSPPRPQPNIVFIMADDLGWSDVGYNGAEFYETPHIDALCRSGIRFNQGYPGAANCMPSRSCIMTGMYTPRTQMWTPGGKSKGSIRYMKLLVPRRADNVGDHEFPSRLELRPSVASIAEVLSQAGYTSAHFGKWHLGPDEQGFDIHDTNGYGADLSRRFYGDIDVAESLTNGAVRFIGEHKDGPFFVYLCHWDVHTPIRSRQAVVDRYHRKLDSGDWSRRWSPTYAAMIDAVDVSVGRIRQALSDNGIEDNTLIVFTSDNGGYAGATWCAPLKGAKGSFYEGGIRVPLCMSWPEVIAAGFVCDIPVTGVDYLPTFAALAGTRLPENQPVDGEALVPLLFGESALIGRAIYWHYPLYLKGVRYNRVIPVAHTDHMYWRATPCGVIRQDDWKLIESFETGTVQLFNLRQDPGEQSDLSKTHPDRTASLLGMLKQWQFDTGAVVPRSRNPSFRPVPWPCTESATPPSQHTDFSL